MLFYRVVVVGISTLIWLSEFFPKPQAPQSLPHYVAQRNYFDKAAVASEHPKCSELAVRIMRQGGSAVDAAITVLLCIGVINNFSSGIGGGGFMLVRQAADGSAGTSGGAELIDFRETAPRGAHRDMFNENPEQARTGTPTCLPLLGGLAVAIPGEIAGMHLAHQRHGKLPWRDLFEPVSALAKEGFPVTLQMHRMIQSNEAEIAQYEELADLYLSDGRALPVGAILRRENLARTLETIGREGPDAFYRGRIAESMARTIKKYGGILDEEDMAAYKPVIRQVIRSTFDGLDVVTGGAPTGGPVLLQALNIIEGLTDLRHPFSPTDVHRLVESLKFAYAGRMQLGDPDYIDADEITRRLLDKHRAAVLRRRISIDTTHAPDYYAESWHRIGKHGTTHVSIVDESGMAVAATSTVNLEFGSLVLDGETGVLLNSEMDDFSIPNHENAFKLPPSESNYIAPGKRPQSSCVPVIVEKAGRLHLVAGGTGGSRIISSLVQVLVGVLRFAETPIGAVALPRLHHQLIPNALLVEHQYDDEIAAELRKKQHVVLRLSSDAYLAAVQLVQVTSKEEKDGPTLIAVADPRKGGAADGY